MAGAADAARSLLVLPIDQLSGTRDGDAGAPPQPQNVLFFAVFRKSVIGAFFSSLISDSDPPTAS